MTELLDSISFVYAIFFFPEHLFKPTLDSCQISGKDMV